MGTAAATGSCPAPADTPRMTYGAADTGRMPGTVPNEVPGVIFVPIGTAGTVPDTVINTVLGKLAGIAILCAGAAVTSAYVGVINDDI